MTPDEDGNRHAESDDRQGQDRHQHEPQYRFKIPGCRPEVHYGEHPQAEADPGEIERDRFGLPGREFVLGLFGHCRIGGDRKVRTRKARRRRAPGREASIGGKRPAKPIGFPVRRGGQFASEAFRCRSFRRDELAAVGPSTVDLRRGEIGASFGLRSQSDVGCRPSPGLRQSLRKSAPSVR